VTQSRAMLCALAAFFAWVLVDTAIKLGSEQALSPFMIMAILGMVGATSLLATALLKHNLASLRPHSLREQSAICLCSAIIGYVNVIALKHLPLTVFYIVVFTAPLVIALFSAFLKHETLTPTKIICLVAGFLGVVLAIGLSGSGGGDWLGCFAALASVFCFAIYTVVMRKISKTDTVASVQFTMSLSTAAVGILGSLQISAAPQSTPLAMMIVAGIINILGNILYNKALQGTSSTNVAQLHYTQIISGALLGYLIWHEVPTWNLIAGSIVIIASGMIVAAQAHKAQPERL